MGGQEPGKVQRIANESNEKKFTFKQGDGLNYSFVTGEGPGENTMKEISHKLKQVPQSQFLAEIRGAKLATQTQDIEPKREIDFEKIAANEGDAGQLRFSPDFMSKSASPVANNSPEQSPEKQK